MIYVFLPAFNEEAALLPLVQKIGRCLEKTGDYKIVVLDDGSSDKTASVARSLSEEYPLELLEHKVNKGLGITMRDGLEYVAKVSKPEDIIITLDCDDTHEPAYMPEAVKKIEQGYDVVILSRYQKGGGEKGLSGLRSILSRGAGLFLKVFFPIEGVWEYSCGYRAFRASALKKAFEIFGLNLIRLPHMGFVVTPELLIKFRMLKVKITEIPFVLRYDQKPGISKNKPLKTIMGYFALLYLYFGRSMRPKEV